MLQPEGPGDEKAAFRTLLPALSEQLHHINELFLFSLPH